MSNFKLTSPLLLLVMLSACASPGGKFPSLERRAYETEAPLAAAAEPPAPRPVLSAELSAKLSALMARHKAAHNAYLRGLPAIQTTASKAAGTSPGSEAWVNAHLVLSRLDKARSDSVAALRDFDGLIDDAGARDTGIAELLTEAQMPIAEEVAAQNAEIARLSRLIGE